MWGHQGDGVWETDLSSSRRSTWPRAKLLSSWPVGAHGSRPTHIKRPMVPTLAAIATQLGQRPATRREQRIIALNTGATEQCLFFPFLTLFYSSWPGLQLVPSSTHSLLLTCPAIDSDSEYLPTFLTWNPHQEGPRWSAAPYMPCSITAWEN